MEIREEEMKAIVIYKTNTGNTKAYADLIAEKLACQTVPLQKISKIKLKDYDTIIFGGWIRASKIVGLSRFKKHNLSQNKQDVLIYAVGANKASEDYLEQVRNKNIEDIDQNPFFYLQGGFDPDKLSKPLKMMLSGVAKSLKKKAVKNPTAFTKEDQEFLDFFQSKHNNVDSNNLNSLLEYIHNR